MVFAKMFFIFVSVVILISCSATASKRSLGEVIDDAVVSNKLKAKFFRDKSVEGSRVNVDTWKGIVTLRGAVDKQEQVNRSIEIAERQRGVREVKSYLVVMHPVNVKVDSVKRDESVDSEVDENNDSATASQEKKDYRIERGVDEVEDAAKEPTPAEEPLIEEEDIDDVPRVTEE